MDAYAAMGMEFGSSLADVTAAFRHKAKQLHPDSNNGDRSAEPELRRMLEAYQFLKEYLSLSNVEPPRSPDATYRPTEGDICDTPKSSVQYVTDHMRLNPSATRCGKVRGWL